MVSPKYQLLTRGHASLTRGLKLQQQNSGGGRETSPRPESQPAVFQGFQSEMELAAMVFLALVSYDVNAMRLSLTSSLGADN